MRQIINLILDASVTGGIVILLWLLTYPVSKKYFRASWHYAVLKITMVFLVFPISVFAPIFNNMPAGLFAKPYIPNISGQIQAIKINTGTINTVNTALSNIVFPENNYVAPLPETDNVKNPIRAEQSSQPDQNSNTEDHSINIPYLQIIWLIFAALLFAGRIGKMQKFKKQILKFSSSDVDREISEIFLQCRKQIKARGKINLRTSEYIKTPLTFGLIRPFVVFPETDMSENEKRIAFTHELTHIKNGDLWIKFFAFIISTIHWFNPFTHLLCRKVSVISEEYCDECVVKSMTKEEKVLYGNLILKVVCDISAPQAKFCSTLSAPTKNFKRRLLNMINTKKSRRSMVALSVIFALMLFSFATVYALAAPSYEYDEKYDADECIDCSAGYIISKEKQGEFTKITIRWINEDRNVGIISTEMQPLLFENNRNGCTLGNHVAPVPVGLPTQSVTHTTPHPNYCVMKVTQKWRCDACYTTGTKTTSSFFWCRGIEIQK